jgi:hypothetical protein
MGFTVSSRVARGIYIHQSGNGAALVSTVLLLVLGLLWFYALLALAIFVAVSLIAYVSLVIGTILMNNARLKELQSRAVSPSTLKVEGNYTAPRTWGVYRVESFKDGQRGHDFHLGNHPIRQRELEREYGLAELVLLFTSRTDAEELKYLLNKHLVSIS